MKKDGFPPHAVAVVGLAGRFPGARDLDQFWQNIRDGVETGEFEPVDPRQTASLIMRSVVVFTHPLVLGQCIDEGEDVEAEARASVRFLLRAITPH